MRNRNFGMAKGKTETPIFSRRPGISGGGTLGRSQGKSLSSAFSASSGTSTETVPNDFLTENLKEIVSNTEDDTTVVKPEPKTLNSSQFVEEDPDTTEDLAVRFPGVKRDLEELETKYLNRIEELLEERRKLEEEIVNLQKESEELGKRNLVLLDQAKKEDSIRRESEAAANDFDRKEREFEENLKEATLEFTRTTLRHKSLEHFRDHLKLFVEEFSKSNTNTGTRPGNHY